MTLLSLSNKRYLVSAIWFDPPCFKQTRKSRVAGRLRNCAAWPSDWAHHFVAFIIHFLLFVHWPVSFGKLTSFPGCMSTPKMKLPNHQAMENSAILSIQWNLLCKLSDDVFLDVSLLHRQTDRGRFDYHHRSWHRVWLLRVWGTGCINKSSPRWIEPQCFSSTWNYTLHKWSAELR